MGDKLSEFFSAGNQVISPAKVSSLANSLDEWACVVSANEQADDLVIDLLTAGAVLRFLANVGAIKGPIEMTITSMPITSQ